MFPMLKINGKCEIDGFSRETLIACDSSAFLPMCYHDSRLAIGLHGRFNTTSRQRQESVALFHLVGRQSPIIGETYNVANIVAQIVRQPLYQPS